MQLHSDLWNPFRHLDVHACPRDSPTAHADLWTSMGHPWIGMETQELLHALHLAMYSYQTALR